MGLATSTSVELTWEVNEVKVLTEAGVEIPRYKALVRSDDGTVLNVPRKSYEVFKNAEFTKLVTDLAEVTGFTVEGYSEFKHGATVLGFLKNKEVDKIGAYDMENYLVVGNSHDYSSSIFVGTSSLFLRCTNQFSRLHKGKGLSVSHTKSQNSRVEELVRYFDFYTKEKEAMIVMFEEFRKTPMTQLMQLQFVRKVLRIKDDKEDLTKSQVANIATLTECIEREKVDLGNNMWAAFNGITYWTTHLKETSQDKVFGNVIGTLADVNERAYNIAKSMVLV